MLFTPLYLTSLKIKSAPTEVSAPKTQTPIVAKQIEIIWEYYSHTIRGICDFTKFKGLRAEKGYILPIKRQKYPHISNYSICLAHIVYHKKFLL